MKLSSLRYLIKEGFRSLWQNKMMALASILVLVSCLLLTGGAYIAFVNVESMFGELAKQNLVVAYTVEGFDAADVQETENKLMQCGQNNVDTIKFTTKEDRLEQDRDKYENTKDLFERLKEKNPYNDMFEITLKDLSLQERTISDIESLDEIEEVAYSDDVAQKIIKGRDIALFIASWIIIILMIVSLFIIVNTVKLTVFNRRLEISIMKSVGATNWFVRFPFIIEGIIMGLASGGISFGITYLIYAKLQDVMKAGILRSGIIDFSVIWPTLLIGYLGIGVLMGILGSIISTSRYLKKEGGISAVI